jgi:Family of unknown function (DUF6491)
MIAADPIHAASAEAAMTRPMTSTTLFLSSLLVALSGAGCASSGDMRDADRLALYRANAGEPVDSIQYFGNYNGWTPLGGGTMALWTRPSQAWLVEVYEPCSDLDYAHTIGIRSIGGRLSARFDRIHVSNNGLIPLECTIKEIRPLDVKAIRVAEKDARAKRQVEAASDAPSSPPPPATPPSGT